MSEDKYRAALDMAAKQLSYRALSAKMLRDKLLAKGHDEEAADYALAWLTERSLLNDTLFAESVVRDARAQHGDLRFLLRGLTLERAHLAAQPLGPHVARAHLLGAVLRRGIDRVTAEAAMQTFSPDEAQMLDLLEKRLCGDVSDRKEVEKAVAALQRRGFAWNDIKRALETYGNSLPEEE